MHPLHTILIANRGEIALRVVRTARQLGLRSVTVYSDADAVLPHARAGDLSVSLGGRTAAESYLDIAKVIGAARRSGATAVHPGYGFLSENPAFARACADAGLVFIGPSPEAMAAMGDKAQAKRLMQAAGVPCIPGYDGADQDEARFASEAARIGYPVMLKATGGGGGKGMRLVQGPAGLPEAIARARSEALKAFGNGHLMIEKAILAPRHVEVQVFADAHGHVVYLGDRDCSIQRRHQKVIEEAPAPGLSDSLRRHLGHAAVQAARSVDYRGAGTVEFLVTADGAYFFLEMNTRLQVEHPVTEEVTGLDLVAWQIAVAAGEPLPLAQEQVRIQGHAIEARLYAEDPQADFLPQSGRLIAWRVPQGEGVRVDHGLCEGAEVSTFYDPMLAKVIARGRDRDEATRRLLRALGEFELAGLNHNRGFLVDVMSAPAFRDGVPTTAFLDEQRIASMLATLPEPRDLAAAAFLLLQHSAKAHAAELRGWRSRPGAPEPWVLDLDGQQHMLQLASAGDGWCELIVGGQRMRVEAVSPAGSGRLRIDGLEEPVHAAWSGPNLMMGRRGRTFTVGEWQPERSTTDAEHQSVARAPMPGAVAALLARVGDTVIKGQTLLVLEAMKMEHAILAPSDGVLSTLSVAVGQQVAMRQVLAEVSPAPAA